MAPCGLSTTSFTHTLSPSSWASAFMRLKTFADGSVKINLAVSRKVCIFANWNEQDAMTEQEIIELQAKIDEGLRLAERRMLQEKALHREDIIVCNDDGIIQRIPAKKALEALAV